MKANLITQSSRVHFIGIGGVGISALARMALGEGKRVTGSDQSPSVITDELSRLGAKIFIGHQAQYLSQAIELVIYTIAIPDDNPELKRARELGITCLSYPEALGLISQEKFTIAIAGTHGKTTTTAMVAGILIAAGLDPTVIVGSLFKNSSANGRTNFIQGNGQPARLNGRSVGYLVVEACEYRRSFLQLQPKILVITNIDNDHLDYFKDIADIESAFGELAAKLPPDGALICDQTNPRLASAIASSRGPVIDYYSSPSQFTLQVPGEHNIWNAQAALAVARTLKIDEGVAVQALNAFPGTWRRFEYKGRSAGGALIYDDYGHHPTEILATLKVARSKCPGKLFVIFQPHLYSRTKLLFADFARSFQDADEVIISDIYAAREPVDLSVSPQALAVAIERNGTSARHLSDFATIRDEVERRAGPHDLILTLGAGDVFLVENQ